MKFTSILNHLSPLFLGLIFILLDTISVGKSFIPRHESLSAKIFIFSSIIGQIIQNSIGSLNTGTMFGPISEIIPAIEKIFISCEQSLNDEGTVIRNNTIWCILIGKVIFAFISFAFSFYGLSKYIKFVPKNLIDGCFFCVGLAQLSYGLKCLTDDGDGQVGLIYIAILAISTGVICFILSEKFSEHPYTIPIFTFLVLIAFHAGIRLFGFNIDTLREQCVLPKLIDESDTLTTKPWKEFKQFFKDFNTSAIVKNSKNIFSLVTLCLIHLPINFNVFVNALKLKANIDKEFFVQGVGNIVSIFPSYFICSNSIFFNKAGGSSRIHGIIVGFLIIVFLFKLDWINSFIPSFIGPMFLIFIGLSIIYSIYNNLKERGWFDRGTVLAVGVMGYFNMLEAGIGMGMILNLYWYLQKTIPTKWKKGTKNTINKDGENIIESNIINDLHDHSVESKTVDDKNNYIVEIDYLLCFATINILEDQFENVEDSVIVDLTQCKGMDWSGEEHLKKLIDNMKSVKILGGDRFKLKWQNI